MPDDFIRYLRIGIWSFGNASWLFGISDRTLAAFADGYLSAIDIAQLFTAAFFFVSWLFLMPSHKR
ncbi:MAG: hypothetical protein HC886_08200 [Leptolyngbyaceae cyanobacterium SM1_1_3]|nr:hypothetical protein [Leptolyngbyaceae cyanobacterium SM1_1_3]NJN04161.1 hypothetical protein [Leptolyngbyaceae cyanobacterium RM1_1_2]NJO10521.1 hypothetical protein [Leptolyngbyaceae cyanobacterium SL_1_1]